MKLKSTNPAADPSESMLDEPDIEVSVRDTFGIDSDLRAKVALTSRR